MAIALIFRVEAKLALVGALETSDIIYGWIIHPMYKSTDLKELDCRLLEFQVEKFNISENQV